MKSRFHPLAALLLLALLNNGAAVLFAVVPGAASSIDAGMVHHAHDGMAGTDSCGMPMGDAGSNCCDQSPCQCGCVATQALLLRPATAARNWLRTESVRAPDTAEFRRGARGAPFRPPA